MNFELITHAMLCKHVATPPFAQYIEILSCISTCFYSDLEEIQFKIGMQSEMNFLLWGWWLEYECLERKLSALSTL